MQWLPAIRWGQWGWVLPLSYSSADALAAVLLARRASTGQGGVAATRAESAGAVQWSDAEAVIGGLADALQRDPALWLFAVLERLTRVRLSDEHSSESRADEVHSSCEPFACEPWELAAWLAERLPSLFSDQDRRLRTEQLVAREGLDAFDIDWSDAWEATRQQAFADVSAWGHHWLRPVAGSLQELAGRLEVAGESAEEAWGESLEWPASMPEYGASQIDLYALASLVSDGESLRACFASRLHSAKLESLRQLAYGLSHEINNPLAGIRTRAEQLLGESDRERRDAGLRRVVDSVMRAHEMIADMMYFARPPRPRPERVKPVELVTEVMAEQRGECHRRGISLRYWGATSDDWILADRDQLTDALRALLDNAVQAVGSDGAIAVGVEWEAERVHFVVSDSGPGVADLARQHAFDPYFSGREAGRGLGLGLCRVYRVASSHGGDAALDAVPIGCRARFWVPRQRQTEVGVASGIRLD